MAPALRLYDPRTGGIVELPRRPALRVGVEGDALRPRVVADLLRRVASRLGRRVFTVASSAGEGWEAYNILPAEIGPITEVDVLVSGTAGPGFCLTVPPETGDWEADLPGPGASWRHDSLAGADPLCIRLAMLETHYREPLELSPARRAAAADRLDRWRGLVARWAESPGRAMDRGYAGEAEEALATDLDSPAAIAVLDRLAEDPDVAPGAKLETFIHIDLLLGLDVVRDIGRR